MIQSELLDPRSEQSDKAAQVLGAVRISAELIAQMPFALPPKGAKITICKLDGWEEAKEVLAKQYPHKQYQIHVTHDFEFGQEFSRYRLWHVPQILEKFVLDNPPGLALCLASGSGREAIYLQSAGWYVTAVDCLESAVAQAIKLEEFCKKAESKPIQWATCSVSQFLPKLLAQNRGFGLITSLMFYQDEMERDLMPLLKENGSLIVSGYTKEFQKVNHKPKSSRRAVDFQSFVRHGFAVKMDDRIGIIEICAKKIPFSRL